MPHIVTTKSVVLSTPVVDGKGKPVTEKVKYNGREVEHQAHDHIQHKAGTVFEIGKSIDKETAKSLVADGHAREHVAGLDDEVTPIKGEPADPLA